MFLKIDNLKKSYGKNTILEDFNLEINKKELICLLGPSGCGKTTVLNCIGGFIKINGGNIILDNKNITNLFPEDREVSTVFQSYGLFPHMTVIENIKYGLKFKNIAKKQASSMAIKMMELVKLHGYENKKINELSGGEKQRVALARSLVVEPKLLLLDEPLSNLDALLRVELRSEIKRIHDELSLTTIFVTHDQEEAFSIADRIILMDKGKIADMGTAEDIYFKPNNLFTLNFIGTSNIIEKNGTNYYTRPEKITIEKPTDKSNAIILEKYFTGQIINYKVKDKKGNLLKVTTLNNKDFKIGDNVYIDYNLNIIN
ncbi:ABC transporter ATP-binding protein [Miniphocaeibacter halophilus]|uniref:ABC transporter ATP-binding protein n=1 Tax=Miniphocaeibacter halophilus TaxID=2931922 RepID=A0AC61N2T7_9FIRM|nr:ABC transporter ATP-binding protein [Miniphocaeibacter halophilus]QQK08861.1 ABC transporter ATP-binding protein [Miniphocaeibacter halophilus]